MKHGCENGKHGCENGKHGCDQWVWVLGEGSFWVWERKNY